MKAMLNALTAAGIEPLSFKEGDDQVDAEIRLKKTCHIQVAPYALGLGEKYSIVEEHFNNPPTPKDYIQYLFSSDNPNLIVAYLKKTFKSQPKLESHDTKEN